MRNLVRFILTACLGISLAACSADNQSAPEKGTLHIAATVFPIYDWCREILGSETDAELTFIMNKGSDLHSFQPSAADMLAIADADLFLYVGGESDEWVEDALKQSVNSDQKSISLMEVLAKEIKEEEIIEGMQAEAEEEPEYDEHVWLSLRNAGKSVRAIADQLCEMDPENAETYQTNAQNYLTKLNDLDQRYTETVRNSETDVLLFGDRFPFRYLVDDYDLTYYAAFNGCSAETEASFETVIFLADKMDEYSLKHVMCIEGSDEKIARTIIANTSEGSMDVLHLDSMQSVNAKDAAGGVSYLSVMENNLNVLENALN